ncbi:hypothetical protein [Nocardiopsis tropica]|uniref:DUF3899 domain-containing protein n=1 Tax=Nocardiopsis tropica TaxID=109330 RepID=A0ABU7KNN9_9ACTN|nr:hypothetical protein [Nocardiopsis umidischolae]MEE2050871.1 hypothetical protein [Nocardiopsis umidischolae]
MVAQMWIAVFSMLLVSLALAWLAWFNHRHFEKLFGFMDGRIEKFLGMRDRKGSWSYNLQKNMATIVISFFALMFFFYFVKSLIFLVGIS